MPSTAGIVEITSEAELRVFFHCAKSFKRAGLWQPQTWHDPAALPSMACIVKDVQPVTETLEELERHYGEEYAKQLYA